MISKEWRVTWSVPTRIPGYEPEWEAYRGDDWGRAYDYARPLVGVIASMCGSQEYRVTPSIERFYTQIRDGELARIEVWSHQSAITLGRPFEPRLLGTILVTRTS